MLRSLSRPAVEHFAEVLFAFDATGRTASAVCDQLPAPLPLTALSPTNAVNSFSAGAESPLPQPLTRLPSGAQPTETFQQIFDEFELEAVRVGGGGASAAIPIAVCLSLWSDSPPPHAQYPLSLPLYVLTTCSAHSPLLFPPAQEA